MKRLFIFTLILLSSCRPEQQDMRSPIEYVHTIIADKSCREQALLTAPVLPENDICIIASSAIAENLADFLAHYDCHDNVSGASLSDLLPDFAGESLDCIKLESNLAQLDTLEQRLISVQSTIAALDTTIYLSPYDMEGLKGKSKSKMIVLAEAVLEQYGRYDIDSLFSSTACAVELISGFDLMMDKVLAEHHDGKPLRIGVIGRKDNEEAILRFVAQKAPEGSRCVMIGSQDSDNLMHALVAEQIARGMKTPLDAVLVDDYDVDMDMLKIELADMLSVLNPDSLIYSNLIEQGVQVLSARQCIAERLYSSLRSGNLFTHKIAYPQINSYKTVVRDGQTILIPGSYVQD